MAGFALVAVLVAAALWRAARAAVAHSRPGGRALGLALNGTKLAVSGVSSWPLVPGDSLATSTSAAVILFADKSRFGVEKNSRVKLEREGDKVLVRLLEGALVYTTARRRPPRASSGRTDRLACPPLRGSATPPLRTLLSR